MYQVNLVNPAFAGTSENLGIGLISRIQWIGFDDAPKTVSLAMEGRLKNQVGAGFSVISDHNGPLSETWISTDVSYHVQLSETFSLSGGIKPGLSFYRAGLTQLELVEQNDLAFGQDVNTTFFTLGAGFFLYSDNFYLGVAVPNFFEADYYSLKSNDQELEYGSEAQHLFVHSRYEWQINQDVILKPSFLVKTALNAPWSFDTNLSVNLYGKFEPGISYRYEDAISGLILYHATDIMRLGFAYDYTLSDIERPSLEAFVLFNFL
ncbi:hypothetical protein GCM10009117_21120 [Gangjinia marincola]|uniref:Type IX secretion system membrane protein PorP/SprF n=2 Tax=Gangjinia marincola TaxID=578463 RepID=A0ABN1MIH1_9FLAO